MNLEPAEAMASTSNADPRPDFLSHSDYFMAVALLAEKMSTKPTKKVGACIVKGVDVVAVGFNQSIKGGDDEQRHYNEYHAEIDAIMNCPDVKGCTIHVTVCPCNECMKLIIQAGISDVVYLRENKDAKLNEASASAKMLSKCFSGDQESHVFKKNTEKDVHVEFKNENLLESAKKKMRGGPQRILMPDFFMGLALLTAMRSRDPNRQVGACIVKDNNKVIALGHNQMPNGKDEEYTWERRKEDNKHLYVCHAELNAIVNSTDVNGCTIYVTMFPCEKCAKLLIKAGIKQVIYLSDEYWKRENFAASKEILKANGVVYEAFYEDNNTQREAIVIKFE